MEWAKLKEGEYPELIWLHAIPNGGQRNVVVASKLKREGVKSGIFDLFLPSAREPYHGLYIEMKFGKNKLTKSQEAFEEFASRQVYKMVVAYSWEEAAEAIEKYLK